MGHLDEMNSLGRDSIDSILKSTALSAGLVHTFMRATCLSPRGY